MIRKGKTSKRIIAASLTGLFLVHQTMALTVVASEITGFNGNNGVFNIKPGAVIPGTDIGYTKYENFNLSKGDIANLIYKYGTDNIETFINLVDNKININGVLNTVRDGQFYNGHAIFVSPNGMVVGASGVLNVGSLGVYTPDNVTYQNYKNNPRADLNELKSTNSGKEITINGKVFAANNVELQGGQITVGKNAGVFAGVNEAKIANNLTNADALFNQLVNTDNLKTGNEFTSNNGQIKITSNRNDASNTAGINIAGDVINYGNGNTELRNDAGSDQGVNISGTVGNLNGKLLVNNNQADTVISGKLINTGDTQITHSTAGGDTSTGLTFDANSGLTISGEIDTQGTLKIQNNGNEGINISGDINHSGGDISIQNGYGFNGVEAQPEYNKEISALDISGNITNEICWWRFKCSK